jgi:hypothetical protein
MIKTMVKKRGKVKRRTDEPSFVDKVCACVVLFVVVGSIVIQHLPL